MQQSHTTHLQRRELKRSANSKNDLQLEERKEIKVTADGKHVNKSFENVVTLQFWEQFCSNFEHNIVVSFCLLVVLNI
jgi:hypothetical protein